MKSEDQCPISAALSGCPSYQEASLIVLFGSRATGAASAESDVDIAVLFPEGTDVLTKLALIGEAEDALKLPVDVVYFSHDLDPVLGWEIVRDGHVVKESTPGLWSDLSRILWHRWNEAREFLRR